MYMRYGWWGTWVKPPLNHGSQGQRWQNASIPVNIKIEVKPETWINYKGIMNNTSTTTETVKSQY